MPLSTLIFDDVTLLLAINTITLLSSAVLIAPNYGATNLNINKKKLRRATYFTGTAFIVLLSIKIFSIILQGS